MPTWFRWILSPLIPRTLAIVAGGVLCLSWAAAGGEPDASGLMPLIERLGLPLVMLLALAWAVWKAAQWIARTVQPHLERMFDAHLKLVKTCDGAVEAMKQNEARQTVAIEAQAEVMRTMGARMELIAQRGCAHPDCFLRLKLSPEGQT
ncbi:MAG: hypothetical protein GC161_18450 [Planctomycetaceae bacterium]|nr:hypothetical protein [Planctomycetaceae bacterium]